jgi:methionyl-tRNA synthetase
MSKSIGNVICPFESLKKYTKDGLRYFLLREGVPSSDCNIHEEKFATFINQELVNTLGNLYQRFLPFNKSMTHVTFGQIKEFLNDKDKEFLSNLNDLRDSCGKHYDVFNFYLGIQLIMSHIRLGNNLIQEYKPWELAKANRDAENNTLKKLNFLVNESLRITSILLQPIVPDLAKDILERLNVKLEDITYKNALVDYERNEPRTMVKKSDVIFKRV